MPITQFEGKALVFNNGVVDVQQNGVSVVDENKIAHITPSEVSIDELTIIKNADNELEVPFDNDTIYRDPSDGFIKARSSGGSGGLDSEGVISLNSREYSLNKLSNVTYSGNGYFEDNWLYSSIIYEPFGTNPGVLFNGPSNLTVQVIEAYQGSAESHTKDAYFNGTIGPWDNAYMYWNFNSRDYVTDPSPSLPSGDYITYLYSASLQVPGMRPDEYDSEYATMKLLLKIGNRGTIDGSYITFTDGQDNPWTFKFRVNTGMKKVDQDLEILSRELVRNLAENGYPGHIIIDFDYSETPEDSVSIIIGTALDVGRFIMMMMGRAPWARTVPDRLFIHEYNGPMGSAAMMTPEIFPVAVGDTLPDGSTCSESNTYRLDGYEGRNIRAQIWGYINDDLEFVVQGGTAQ